MLKKSRLQIKQTYIVSGLIGLLFLACSFIFLQNLMRQSERESMTLLHNAADIQRNALERQIAGDFQTLQGVAACLPYLGRAESDQVVSIIKEINENNNFTRMGIAGLDGMADLFDTAGVAHKQHDISYEFFFQRALRGEQALSYLMRDPFGPGMISYCAVPMIREGEIVGVLVAVNSSDVFKAILTPPLFDGRGYSGIIDSTGFFVLEPTDAGGKLSHSSIPGPNIFSLGTLAGMEQEEIKARLTHSKSGAFFYEDGPYTRVAAFSPLGFNNWFLFSSVPAAPLKQNYDTVLFAALSLIGGAVLIFLLLMWRIYSIGEKNREELEYLAFTDPLTGGRNMIKLSLDADDLVRDHPEQAFAVWYGDVRNFKFFNEMFGYDAGDEELRRIMDIFEQSMGQMALSGRISADNYAGIHPLTDRADLLRRFQAVAASIAKESVRPASSFRLEINMGIFVAEPAHIAGTPLSFEEMLNRASIAQKAAMLLPGNNMVFYHDSMRDDALRAADREANMERALAEDEFTLFFQPKVNIQTGNRIVGAEALARWNDGGKLVPPGEFIPLFEKNGFIVNLDRYMFAKACAWLHQRLQVGLPPLNIAINVSRLGLLQEDFVSYYTGIKNQYAIPDGILELEFTESMVLTDYDMLRGLVHKMQQAGFLCSLDDFGAGASSLNVLKNLPIHLLKLDILFFRQRSDIKRERIVLSHVISMARELGIKIIAEGVESAEQVLFLRRAGCHAVQGYIFARPMSCQAFEALLAKLDGEAMPMAGLAD